MERTRVLIVDAFTEEPLTGNAAGVVPDADGLNREQMRAIARELNASETAFLQSTGAADRRIRYFTPTDEVDLCGHATIASHAHLFTDGVIGAGTHTLETNVGVLDVEVGSDGTVWMTQDQPEIRAIEGKRAAVADALGIDATALDVEDLPIAVSSTGLPFLIAPVDFLEHLGDVTPDTDAVEALCEETDTVGIYAFTFDTLEGASTLHGRMFAPLVGVPEDPVTGTASGAAGAYLRRFDAFDETPEEMRFEQGHFVDRPGTVRVRVGTEVRVGGRAVTAVDGDLRVPDREPEEIIEV